MCGSVGHSDSATYTHPSFMSMSRKQGYWQPFSTNLFVLVVDREVCSDQVPLVCLLKNFAFLRGITPFCRRLVSGCEGIWCGDLLKRELEVRT